MYSLELMFAGGPVGNLVLPWKAVTFHILPISLGVWTVYVDLDICFLVEHLDQWALLW